MKAMGITIYSQVTDPIQWEKNFIEITSNAPRDIYKVANVIKFCP